jgi:hypothetical protein
VWNILFLHQSTASRLFFILVINHLYKSCKYEFEHEPDNVACFLDGKVLHAVQLDEVRKVIAMVAWPAAVFILAFSPVNPSDL